MGHKNMTADQIAKAEAKAVAMRAEGAKWPEILTKTGLSHSRAELAVMRAQLTPAEVKRVVALVAKEGAEKASVTLRGEGLSWGEISVRLNVPESKVRAHFKATTGNKSQGLRVNHGGRFFYDDPILYEDTLRPTGTTIPADYQGREAARGAAVNQRLMNLEFNEVKSYAKDLGVAVPKGTTKAKLVLAIAKKLGATPVVVAPEAKAS